MSTVFILDPLADASYGTSMVLPVKEISTELLVESPTSGIVGVLTTVELDEKGRVLLPASIRKKLGARRFEVNLLDDRIELIPLGSVKALKGKHKGLLSEPWWRLEERADRYVREGKR
jgi:AbrB family looped-hinge helix DNA binding protein